MTLSMTRFLGNVSCLLPFLLLSLLLHGCIGDNNIAVQLNDDVLGLIVFKSDVEDPSSHLSSWNEDDETPCSWKFVVCHPVTNRVSEVSLDNLGLSGRIGKGLEKLQHLKILSLSGNNFSGDVTPEKLALPTSRLRVLNLSRNRLSALQQ